MKKAIWIALLAGGVYALIRARRGRLYHPDELYNLFWDDQNDRWRTYKEVLAILKEHPERVPEPLLEGEARVLSYLAEIEAASEEFRIDAPLIAALISKESGGDWTARGPVGEYGLMQIRATTAQMMGYTGDAERLLHPHRNVWYGTKYLRWQMDRYAEQPNPVQWAVAAYHAGTATFSGGKFRTTKGRSIQGYVDSVVKQRWPRYTYLINRIHGIYSAGD